MGIDDICSMRVSDISDENSVLFIWATYPMIELALQTINRWGFKYKTVAFTWVKTNKNDRFFTGMGYYTRANPEICLLATKGKIIKRLSRSVKNLTVSQRGIHSRKPPEIRTKITNLFGDIPRIELFAREKIPGWDMFGNEVESDVII